MSDEKNDNDKKKKDNDPYDFFKLVTDSDKNPKDNKKPKVPFWLVLLIGFAAIIFINLFFSSRPDTTISFSEFKQLIIDGKIVRVELGQNYFTGYGTNAVPQSYSKNDTLSNLLMSSASVEKYQTAAILTEDFLKLLDEKGVDYKAVVKQNSILLEILLNWVVPFGLIFLMYRFLFRRMGGGFGGGMGIFSAGQSRATAVEEGKVTTRFKDVAGVDEA